MQEHKNDLTCTGESCRDEPSGIWAYAKILTTLMRILYSVTADAPQDDPAEKVVSFSNFGCSSCLL